MRKSLCDRYDAHNLYSPAEIDCRRLWIGLKRPSASLKQRVQTLLGPLGLMANLISGGLIVRVGRPTTHVVGLCV